MRVKKANLINVSIQRLFLVDSQLNRNFFCLKQTYNDLKANKQNIEEINQKAVKFNQLAKVFIF